MQKPFKDTISAVSCLAFIVSPAAGQVNYGSIPRTCLPERVQSSYDWRTGEPYTGNALNSCHFPPKEICENTNFRPTRTRCENREMGATGPNRYLMRDAVRYCVTGRGSVRSIMPPLLAYNCCNLCPEGSAPYFAWAPYIPKEHLSEERKRWDHENIGRELHGSGRWLESGLNNIENREFIWLNCRGSECDKQFAKQLANESDAFKDEHIAAARTWYQQAQRASQTLAAPDVEPIGNVSYVYKCLKPIYIRQWGAITGPDPRIPPPNYQGGNGNGNGNGGSRDTDGDQITDANCAGTCGDGIHTSSGPKGSVTTGVGSNANPGGPTVLCTYFTFERGWIDRKDYFATCRYVKKHINQATLSGYHYWAVPLVRHLRQHKGTLLEKVMFKIVEGWVLENAYREGVRSKGNTIGKLFHLAVKPACTLIGKHNKTESNYQSLWQPAYPKGFLDPKAFEKADI